MFSRTHFSDFRTGDTDKITYTWTRKDRIHAVLVATCLKINDQGKTVGIYSAFKQAEDIACDPEEFAEQNHWYGDLEYEIAEQMDSNEIGHFDLETYISIHNTSIRTRA